MSDENSTHFQFRLGGIELEISGERKFVEEMYGRMMRDIDEARRKALGRKGKQRDAVPAADRQIVWVHRCSPMMHKIYMSSPIEVARAPLMRQIDANELAIVFADKDVFDHVLPGGGRGHTLWAELTAKGRKRIAAAAPDR